ncbi:MAG: FAD-dependent oxidoreductase [Myxococcota bacterium]
MSSDFLVVGAGIAGLAAALRLNEMGYSVELREARPEAGGLLAPINVDGVPCDRGSHRLHAEGRAVLDRMSRIPWMTRPRRGRIVIGGRHANYPLGLRGFLRSLGLRTSMAFLAGFLTRRRRFHRFRMWERDRTNGVEADRGFQDFVESRVGRVAYRNFYEPYARKVWGVDPNTMSQTIAKQRVSTSRPADVLRGRIRTSPTFLYPRDGMHEVLRSTLDRVRALGTEVRFGVPFDPHEPQSRPVLYSGHLGDLVANGPFRGEWGHRGLYLLHTVVHDSRLTDPSIDTWYVPDPRFWFGRVSLPARFSERFRHRDGTILCIEIPEGNWGQDVDFTTSDRATALFAQLTEAGILHPGSFPLIQTFEPRVYPLYPRGWVARWRSALATVPNLGPILPIGRQGLYLHCNVDHAVRTALDAADHVHRGRTSAEWVANADRYLDVVVRD